MHIKLIVPRMSLRPMDSEYKRLLSPSLALLTVAALTPPGHQVTVADENAGALDLDDAPDLVGITVNVDTSTRAYAIAARYRQRGIPVVCGGIHVSANPAEALEHADAVCIGEAETQWARILSDAAAGRLQGQYRSDEPADLARSPAPRWDLIQTSRYLYTNVVCASRGCPFACEFCYNSCAYVHRRYRNKPVAQVIDEIRRLGTKQVLFIDDNFVGDVDRTRELLQAIQPLGLKWHAAVSTNVGLHPGLLDQMRDTGCQSLFIGFESVNQASVAGANKCQNHVDRYDTLIDEIHARGIMVNASLVFGFDHDTSAVFPGTLDWLVQNGVETMTAHILTPYPGTKLYERLKREDRIVDEDWRHYNTAHVVYEPRHMTREELHAGYLWMYDRFYSLENILRRMPTDPGRRLPYLLFNLGYRKYGKATSQVARLGLMNALGRAARRVAYGIE